MDDQLKRIWQYFRNATNNKSHFYAFTVPPIAQVPSLVTLLWPTATFLFSIISGVYDTEEI